MSDQLSLLQQQLADIEMKMAFHEDAQVLLEKELVAQQAMINKQDWIIAELFERIKELRSEAGAQAIGQDDAPPPHYWLLVATFYYDHGVSVKTFLIL